MIGHLQRNKGKISDRESDNDPQRRFPAPRGVKSAKKASRRDAQTDILLEINCAGEESKFGIRPKDTLALVRQIAVLPNVHIRG